MDSILEDKKRALWELPDSIVDFIQSIVIALIICVILYLLIAMPNQVQGSSMEPNFSQGQIILTNKLSTWMGDTQIGHSLGFNYERGDVIVFKKPDLKNEFIKRIIGIPGDTVAIHDGKVYINGEALDESEYLANDVSTIGGTFIVENDEAIKIPANSFFVLGDNRSNSHDSRSIDVGFIKEEWIRGEVELRYWPSISIFNRPNYNL